MKLPFDFQQLRPEVRRVLLLSGAVLFVIFFLLLLSSVTKIGKAAAEIKVSPMDASITIDGKKARSGKIQLSKGTRTIVAKRAHFKDTTVTVRTSELPASNNIVYVIMEPADDAGNNYILNNHDEQMLREAASGNEFSLTQNALRNKYPFLADMPYESLDYTIDYRTQSDNRTIKLLVSINMPASLRPSTPAYDEWFNYLKGQAQSYMSQHNIDYTKIQTDYEAVQ